MRMNSFQHPIFFLESKGQQTMLLFLCNAPWDWGGSLREESGQSQYVQRAAASSTEVHLNCFPLLHYLFEELEIFLP